MSINIDESTLSPLTVNNSDLDGPLIINILESGLGKVLNINSAREVTINMPNVDPIEGYGLTLTGCNFSLSTADKNNLFIQNNFGHSIFIEESVFNARSNKSILISPGNGITVGDNVTILVNEGGNFYFENRVIPAYLLSNIQIRFMSEITLQLASAATSVNFPLNIRVVENSTIINTTFRRRVNFTVDNNKTLTFKNCQFREYSGSQGDNIGTTLGAYFGEGTIHWSTATGEVNKLYPRVNQVNGTYLGSNNFNLSNDLLNQLWTFVNGSSYNTAFTGNAVIYLQSGDYSSSLDALMTEYLWLREALYSFRFSSAVYNLGTITNHIRLESIVRNATAPKITNLTVTHVTLTGNGDLEMDGVVLGTNDPDVYDETYDHIVNNDQFTGSLYINDATLTTVKGHTLVNNLIQLINNHLTPSVYVYTGSPDTYNIDNENNNIGGNVTKITLDANSNNSTVFTISASSVRPLFVSALTNLQFTACSFTDGFVFTVNDPNECNLTINNSSLTHNEDTTSIIESDGDGTLVVTLANNTFTLNNTNVSISNDNAQLFGNGITLTTSQFDDGNKYLIVEHEESINFNNWNTQLDSDLMLEGVIVLNGNYQFTNIIYEFSFELQNNSMIHDTIFNNAQTIDPTDYTITLQENVFRYLDVTVNPTPYLFLTNSNGENVVLSGNIFYLNQGANLSTLSVADLANAISNQNLENKIYLVPNRIYVSSSNDHYPMLRYLRKVYVDDPLTTTIDANLDLEVVANDTTDLRIRSNSLSVRNTVMGNNFNIYAKLDSEQDYALDLSGGNYIIEGTDASMLAIKQNPVDSCGSTLYYGTNWFDMSFDISSTNTRYLNAVGTTVSFVENNQTPIRLLTDNSLLDDVRFQSNFMVQRNSDLKIIKAGAQSTWVNLANAGNDTYFKIIEYDVSTLINSTGNVLEDAFNRRLVYNNEPLIEAGNFLTTTSVAGASLEISNFSDSLFGFNYLAGETFDHTIVSGGNVAYIKLNVVNDEQVTINQSVTFNPNSRPLFGIHNVGSGKLTLNSTITRIQDVSGPVHNRVYWPTLASSTNQRPFQSSLKYFAESWTTAPNYIDVINNTDNGLVYNPVGNRIDRNGSWTVVNNGSLRDLPFMLAYGEGSDISVTGTLLYDDASLTVTNYRPGAFIGEGPVHTTTLDFSVSQELDIRYKADLSDGDGKLVFINTVAPGVFDLTLDESGITVNSFYMRFKPFQNSNDFYYVGLLTYTDLVFNTVMYDLILVTDIQDAIPIRFQPLENNQFRMLTTVNNTLMHIHASTPGNLLGTNNNTNRLTLTNSATDNGIFIFKNGFESDTAITFTEQAITTAMDTETNGAFIMARIHLGVPSSNRVLRVFQAPPNETGKLYITSTLDTNALNGVGAQPGGYTAVRINRVVSIDNTGTTTLPHPITATFNGTHDGDQLEVHPLTYHIRNEVDPPNDYLLSYKVVDDNLIPLDPIPFQPDSDYVQLSDIFSFITGKVRFSYDEADEQYLFIKDTSLNLRVESRSVVDQLNNVTVTALTDPSADNLFEIVADGGNLEFNNYSVVWPALSTLSNQIEIARETTDQNEWNVYTTSVTHNVGNNLTNSTNLIIVNNDSETNMLVALTKDSFQVDQFEVNIDVADESIPVTMTDHKFVVERLVWLVAPTFENEQDTSMSVTFSVSDITGQQQPGEPLDFTVDVLQASDQNENYDSFNAELGVLTQTDVRIPVIVRVTMDHVYMSSTYGCTVNVNSHLEPATVEFTNINIPVRVKLNTVNSWPTGNPAGQLNTSLKGDIEQVENTFYVVLPQKTFNNVTFGFTTNATINNNGGLLDGVQSLTNNTSYTISSTIAAGNLSTTHYFKTASDVIIGDTLFNIRPDRYTIDNNYININADDTNTLVINYTEPTQHRMRFTTVQLCNDNLVNNDIVPTAGQESWLRPTTWFNPEPVLAPEPTTAYTRYSMTILNNSKQRLAWGSTANILTGNGGSIYYDIRFFNNDDVNISHMYTVYNSSGTQLTLLSPNDTWKYFRVYIFDLSQTFTFKPKYNDFELPESKIVKVRYALQNINNTNYGGLASDTRIACLIDYSNVDLTTLEAGAVKIGEWIIRPNECSSGLEIYKNQDKLFTFTNNGTLTEHNQLP